MCVCVCVHARAYVRVPVCMGEKESVYVSDRVHVYLRMCVCRGGGARCSSMVTATCVFARACVCGDRLLQENMSYLD